MTEEKHAERLARWVGQVLDPAAPPAALPDDLDDDVLEAIAALRPDRAPPPRVTADEILAGIGAGPLAARTALPAAPPPPANQPTLPSGGVAIAFPSPATVSGVPRRRRWWAAAGGVGGVGILAAVAASLLVVLSPQGERRPAALSAPATASPPAIAAEPPAEPLPVTTTLDAPVRSGPIPEAAVAPSRAPQKAAEEAPRVQREAAAPPADVVLDAKADERDKDALGYLGQTGASPAPGAAPSDEIAAQVASDDRVQEQQRGRSERSDKTPAASAGAAAAAPPALANANTAEKKEASEDESSAWSDGLDGQTVARFDAARAEATALASRGDYAGAAARLSQVITSPARAGMYHAALAADYWLEANNPAKAAEVARVGLALSSTDSPERRALLARLDQAASRVDEAR